MNFADELCNISANEALCESTWNKIKPYLVKIASDRNAKGCHIRFVGFEPSFSQQMRKFILSDGLHGPAYSAEVLYRASIAARQSPFLPYPCVSDKWLQVILTSSKTVVINELPLTEEVYNDFLCHYISYFSLCFIVLFAGDNLVYYNFSEKL